MPQSHSLADKLLNLSQLVLFLHYRPGKRYFDVNKPDIMVPVVQSQKEKKEWI